MNIPELESFKDGLGSLNTYKSFVKPRPHVCYKNFRDYIPGELMKLLKYSCYKPCDELIEAVRYRKSFNSSIAERDIRRFLEMYVDCKSYAQSSYSQRETIGRAISCGLVELAKYHIESEKYEVDITYHAAERFVRRYSEDYSFASVTRTTNKEAIRDRKEAIARFFRKAMYPTLLRIYKKGKDPYKFKKTNPRLAEYLEHKKKLHGEGIKVKVYGDSIWIFGMNGKVATLITMYEIPYDFFYRAPEDEKIESFYELLRKEKLLDIPILIGSDEKFLGVTFPKKGKR